MVQGELIVISLPLHSAVCIDVSGSGYSGPCGLGQKRLGLLVEGKKPRVKGAIHGTWSGGCRALQPPLPARQAEQLQVPCGMAL